jgi:hypothetical protein
MDAPMPRTGKSPKRPLVVGAILGGLVGALFGLVITLLNLGGKGDWTLAVPGAVLDGAFLGVIVGAIVRETRAEQGERAAQQGRLRVILLWAAVVSFSF